MSRERTVTLYPARSGSGGGGGPERDPVFTAWKATAIDPDTGQFNPDLIPGGSSGSVPEAPEDGTIYGRKDGEWAAIPAEGSGITDVQVDGHSVVTDGIAQIMLPPIPEVTTKNVRAMFEFSPDVPDAKVWMREAEGVKPEIVIEIENATNDANDLTITPAGGFGAYYDHFDNHAIILPGKEQKDDGTGNLQWVTGMYDVTISRETDRAQSQIIVPWQIWNCTIKYNVGQTETPVASYWEDTEGNIFPFEFENTPMSDLVPLSGTSEILINGKRVSLDLLNADYFGLPAIKSIKFGSSYKQVTFIPQNLLFGIPTSSPSSIDLSGLSNITFVGSGAFENLVYCSTIQIGSWDVTNVVTENIFNFAGCGGMASGVKTIYADTLEIGQTFKNKFEHLFAFTVAVNGKI